MFASRYDRRLATPPSNINNPKGTATRKKNTEERTQIAAVAARPAGVVEFGAHGGCLYALGLVWFPPRRSCLELDFERLRLGWFAWQAIACEGPTKQARQREAPFLDPRAQAHRELAEISDWDSKFGVLGDQLLKGWKSTAGCKLILEGLARPWRPLTPQRRWCLIPFRQDGRCGQGTQFRGRPDISGNSGILSQS
jgi:hypothetical protein